MTKPEIPQIFSDGATLENGTKIDVSGEPPELTESQEQELIDRVSKEWGEAAGAMPYHEHDDDDPDEHEGPYPAGDDD
jgi:hypothetical protein